MDLLVEKIVGAQAKKAWSQTHVFQPKKREQKNKGSLFACLSFSVLTEGLDVTSFGKEIILRLHENYYSADSGSRLKRLKTAVSAVTEEFADKVLLRIQAGVLFDKALYLVINSGQVCLWRDQNLLTLLKSTDALKAVSGYLKNSDRFVLGSTQFFEVIPLGTLKAALGFVKLSKTVDILAPIVHAHIDSSQTVSLLLNVSVRNQAEALEPEIVVNKKAKLSLPQIKKPNIPSLSEWKNKLKGIKSAFKKPKIQKPDLGDKDKKKARQKTIIIAIILLFLLFVSLFFGTKRKKQEEYKTWQQEAIQPALTAIDKSVDLQPDNPLQAKTMLIQAQDQLALEKLDLEDEKKIAEIDSVLAKLEEQLSFLTGLQKINNPKLFLDLSLIKSDFVAIFVSFDNKDLVLGSGKTSDDQEIYLIDADSKKHDKISLDFKGEKLKSAALLNDGKRLAYLTNKNLFVYDLVKNKQIQKKEADWGTSQKLIGFESNIYLLQNDDILKFVGIDGGVGDSKSYLKNKSDWQGKDMGIDGFVWVLTDNTLVYKYISGKRDSFVMLGVEELSDDLMFYTDKYLDNLYLLDRQKTKIYQVDKSGEYQSSFLWPGLAGTLDFVVSEERGEIYLLTKDRIYTISLNDTN